jgi:hypothetical protein
MTERVVIRENVTDFLDIVRGRLRDQRASLAHLIPEVRAYFQRQFETAGQEGGSSWPMLNAATMEKKAHMGLDVRPLMLTGTLWASLTQEGARYGYAVLGPHSVRVGTRDPVAHLLRDGTRRGIPARDIEGEPPPHTIERWADLVADDLLE